MQFYAVLARIVEEDSPDKSIYFGIYTFKEFSVRWRWQAALFKADDRCQKK